MRTKDIIAESMASYLLGKVQYHKANVKLYLENPAGIGEHPDILQAVEVELANAADYAEKLCMLKEICKEHG
tara:strand:+ start:1417 stop:1632 length:216 start_codon:yes stop_codon:yes gene_type:complete